MVLSDSTTNGKPGSEWVGVEGGTFQMGNALYSPNRFDRGNPNEIPVHFVKLRNFYVSKTEVTQGLYHSVTGNNPSRFLGDDTKPVEQVSWHDAVAFCNALSRRDGLTPCYTVDGTAVVCNFDANGYRLGTEAEWEYAARGGKQSLGYLYSGSNRPEDVAWDCDNSGYQTHPVGKKAPNELGLYDMSGNVEEWCWDWDGPYKSEMQIDPAGPSSGTNRVRRGGGWDRINRDVRTTARSSWAPTGKSDKIGFRLFRTE